MSQRHRLNESLIKKYGLIYEEVLRPFFKHIHKHAPQRANTMFKKLIRSLSKDERKVKAIPAKKVFIYLKKYFPQNMTDKKTKKILTKLVQQTIRVWNRKYNS